MKTKTEEFLHHAARAFFACAWADMAEEFNCTPWPAGGEIMAYMPETIDPAAIHAAKTLQFDVERVNGKTIEELMRIVETEGDGDRPNTPEYFGNYCAMQAMGHGVGLSDAFGSYVDEKIKVPYVDFGSHSLERDYFAQGGTA